MPRVETADGGNVIVQGFRKGGGRGAPYVFMSAADKDDNLLDEFELTTENAHVLSEVIRQEAEFANSGRESGGNN